MKFDLLLLGAGSGDGVPTITGSWGDCDPNDPNNRRTRSSALLQINGMNILIDASPDVYVQLIRENITHIDAVIITHIHYDHIAGLGELFCMLRAQNRKIPLYTDTRTLKSLQGFFSYAFQGEKLCGFSSHVIAYGGQDILGVPFFFFPQIHGKIMSLGVRIGDLGYSIDALRLEEKAFQALENVRTWVVPVRGFNDTSGHAGLTTVLTWIERVSPDKVYMINLGDQMDYKKVKGMLPSHIMLGVDGMTIEGVL